MIYGTHDMLLRFQEISPYFNIILEEDIGIFVYDQEKLLIYVPSTSIDLGLKIGSPVVEGTIPDRCMKSKKRIVTIVSKEKSRLKIPYLSCATPVSDGTGVIGCIITNQDLNIYNNICETSQSLSQSSQDLYASMEEVSAQAQQLNEAMGNLDELSKAVCMEITNTDNIVEFIRNIIKRTNLLGLNAAIEASHLGDLGQGFGIVAKEIREMAQESARSIKEITDSVSNIQENTTMFTSLSNQIREATEKLAAVAEEVAAASVLLSGMAGNLTAFSEKMYRTTE